MDFRIFTEPQQGASYATLRTIARKTEELGFDAFFRSDHYLTMGGDGLPGPSDAWITLAGLARDTSRVRLGTLVTPATFRLPGPLAVAVANVDEMSGGRVEFGFGAGWFDAEHTAYGIPFPDLTERFERFEEQLEILDGLWRTPPGDTYSFVGKHYTLTDSPGLPKPVQSPRPPIVLGGAGKKRSAELAARFADEYNVAFKDVTETGRVFERIRATVSRELVCSVAQVVCAGRTDAELARRAGAIGRELQELRANGLAGSPAEIVDKIGRYAERGASRIYFQVLDLSDLEHLELVAADVVSQFGPASS